MIRIFLTFLLMTLTANSAEILVKARNHNTFNADTTGWSIEKKMARQRANLKGAPVIVKPNNHPWGSAETLPGYVIIKIPGVNYDSLKKYLEPMVDSTDDKRILLRRSFRFPPAWVNRIIADSGGVATISKQTLRNVIIRRKRQELEFRENR